MTEKNAQSIDLNEAYRVSVDFLRQCGTDYGFRAALVDRDNYYRVWGRDGVVNGLAALMTGEEDLFRIFRSNLEYLASFQGRSGQIPSNICPETGDMSYGRTAGRVDPTLWFVIGCAQYHKRTGDDSFLAQMHDYLKRAMAVLEAWEFNQQDFLFVPNGGDWADEAPRHGYIFFDQLLYNRAILEYLYAREHIGYDSDIYWREKYERQKDLIRVNFWPDAKQVDWEYVYHNEVFRAKRERITGQKYWLESFYPGNFFDRFDAFANILAILFGFSDRSQSKKTIDHILESVPGSNLVQAFHPVIFPEDKELWQRLQGNYSYRFKNKPYHYINGGLWPMLSGFFVQALVKNEREEIARKYLDGVNEANAGPRGKWDFYEYHDSLEKLPGGVKHTAWSAAGGIMAYEVLINKKQIFL
jgi:hypothetical protein